jgi:hypothetical protein
MYGRELPLVRYMELNLFCYSEQSYRRGECEVRLPHGDSGEGKPIYETVIYVCTRLAIIELAGQQANEAECEPDNRS